MTKTYIYNSTDKEIEIEVIEKDTEEDDDGKLQAYMHYLKKMKPNQSI